MNGLSEKSQGKSVLLNQLSMYFVVLVAIMWT